MSSLAISPFYSIVIGASIGANYVSLSRDLGPVCKVCMELLP
jgi:hypothetical protein